MGESRSSVSARRGAWGAGGGWTAVAWGQAGRAEGSNFQSPLSAPAHSGAPTPFYRAYQRPNQAVSLASTVSSPHSQAHTRARPRPRTRTRTRARAHAHAHAHARTHTRTHTHTHTHIHAPAALSKWSASSSLSRPTSDASSASRAHLQQHAASHRARERRHCQGPYAVRREAAPNSRGALVIAGGPPGMAQAGIREASSRGPGVRASGWGPSPLVGQSRLRLRRLHILLQHLRSVRCATAVASGTHCPARKQPLPCPALPRRRRILLPTDAPIDGAPPSVGLLPAGTPRSPPRHRTERVSPEAAAAPPRGERFRPPPAFLAPSALTSMLTPWNSAALRCASWAASSAACAVQGHARRRQLRARSRRPCWPCVRFGRASALTQAQPPFVPVRAAS
jgi:hypothetical protein